MSSNYPHTIPNNTQLNNNTQLTICICSYPNPKTRMTQLPLAKQAKCVPRNPAAYCIAYLCNYTQHANYNVKGDRASARLNEIATVRRLLLAKYSPHRRKHVFRNDRAVVAHHHETEVVTSVYDSTCVCMCLCVCNYTMCMRNMLEFVHIYRIYCAIVRPVLNPEPHK